MKIVKNVFVVMCCLVFAAKSFCCQVWAENAAGEAENQTDVIWKIENCLEQKECRQGDTIMLSIYLESENPQASQNISKIRGVLEYDNSLFCVDSLHPVESEKVYSQSFEETGGVFEIQYDSDIVVKNNGLLFQIQLCVPADASVGKTTVCVTYIQWQDAAGQQTTEIEHRIPEKLLITEALYLSGDVNEDGIVNLSDAKLVMQYYNKKKKLNSRQKKRADVNKDGRVNLTDAKLIMKYCNGEITEF